MPKIAAQENDIDFYIFVSPAINWQRQSQFMSALRERDLSAEAIAARRLRRVHRLIRCWPQMSPMPPLRR